MLSFLSLLILCKWFQLIENKYLPLHAYHEANSPFVMPIEEFEHKSLKIHSWRRLNEDCPEGFNSDPSGNCIRCPVNNCAYCPRQYCEACKLGFALTDFWNCLPCHDTNCQLCFNEDAGLCKSCIVNYTLHRNKCIKCNILSCQLCVQDDECVRCTEGTYLDILTRKCLPCDAFCSICTEKSKCIRCFDGFTLNNKFLCEGNILNSKNCDRFDGQDCISCRPGFRINTLKNICEACLKDNCKYCLDDLNSCSECLEGYILDPSGKCSKCQVGCASCVPPGDKNSCTSCLAGYSLKIGTCDQCRIKNCHSCNNNLNLCEKCKTGYYLEQPGQICKACPYNCDECYEGTCTLCSEGSEMKKTSNECRECDPQCEVNYCNEDGSCLLCQNGYYLRRDLTESYCVSCGIGCSICNDEGECMLPERNFYLYNKTIVRECPPNTKFNSYRCLHCNVKYCLDCSETNFCLECSYGYLPNKEGQCECNKFTSFFDEKASKCQVCSILFKNCEQCNQTACFKCHEPYTLNKTPNKTSADFCLSVPNNYCPEHCIECQNSTSCTTCLFGYLSSIEAPYCKINCNTLIPHCLECAPNLQCFACETGYFLINESRACGRCFTTCANCTGPKESQCITCLDQVESKITGKCLVNCKNFVDNCQECEGALSTFCLLCREGYMTSFKKDKCIRCPPNCLQCAYSNESAIFCLEADPEYIFGINNVSLLRKEFDTKEFIENLTLKTEYKTPNYDLSISLEILIELRKREPLINIDKNLSDNYERILLNETFSIIDYITNDLANSDDLKITHQILFQKQRIFKAVNSEMVNRNCDKIANALKLYFQSLDATFAKKYFIDGFENILTFSKILDVSKIKQANLFNLFKYLLGKMSQTVLSTDYKYNNVNFNLTIAVINMSFLRNGVNLTLGFGKNSVSFPKPLISKLAENNTLFSNFLKGCIVSIDSQNQSLIPSQQEMDSTILSNLIYVSFFDTNGNEFLSTRLEGLVEVKMKLSEPFLEIKNSSKIVNSTSEFKQFCGVYENETWLPFNPNQTNFIKNTSIGQVECPVNSIGMLGFIKVFQKPANETHNDTDPLCPSDPIKNSSISNGTTQITTGERDINNVGSLFFYCYLIINLACILLALFIKRAHLNPRHELVSIEDTRRYLATRRVLTIFPLASIYQTISMEDKKQRTLLFLNMIYSTQLLTGYFRYEWDQGAILEILKQTSLFILSSYLQGILFLLTKNLRKSYFTNLFLLLINGSLILLAWFIAKAYRNTNDLLQWLERWALLIALDTLLDSLLVLYFYFLKSSAFIKCLAVVKLKGFYHELNRYIAV